MVKWDSRGDRRLKKHIRPRASPTSLRGHFYANLGNQRGNLRTSFPVMLPQRGIRHHWSAKQYFPHVVFISRRTEKVGSRNTHNALPSPFGLICNARLQKVNLNNEAGVEKVKWNDKWLSHWACMRQTVSTPTTMQLFTSDKSAEAGDYPLCLPLQHDHYVWE